MHWVQINPRAFRVGSFVLRQACSESLSYPCSSEILLGSWSPQAHWFMMHNQHHLKFFSDPRLCVTKGRTFGRTFKVRGPSVYLSQDANIMSSRRTPRMCFSFATSDNVDSAGRKWSKVEWLHFRSWKVTYNLNNMWLLHAWNICQHLTPGQPEPTRGKYGM